MTISAYPKITIVTPSFNQGLFLEETIRSVASQGYPKLEYIVMDGGSTDGSIEIIRKHRENITFWRSERDAGQSDALRKGFQRASGDILAWLNSDDTLEPGTLRTVGEYFAAHPDIDLVYGNMNLIDPFAGLIFVITERQLYFVRKIAEGTLHAIRNFFQLFLRRL